jgi:hypothetical protein
MSPNQLRSANNLVHEQSLNILMLKRLRTIVPRHAAGPNGGLGSMSDSFPTRFPGDPSGKISVACTGVTHYTKVVVMLYWVCFWNKYTQPKVDLFADHIIAHLLPFTPIYQVCLPLAQTSQRFLHKILL